MTFRLARSASVSLLALTATLAGAAQVDDATAVKMALPHELVVAGDLSPAQREAMLTPINNLYGRAAARGRRTRATAPSSANRGCRCSRSRRGC